MYEMTVEGIESRELIGYSYIQREIERESRTARVYIHPYRERERE